jgi:hypothetical protein
VILKLLVEVEVEACDPDNDPVADNYLRAAAVDGVRNALYEAQGNGFEHEQSDTTSIIVKGVKPLDEAKPVVLQEFANGPVQVVIPADLTGLKIDRKKV